MENHMTDGKLQDYNLERKNIDEKINFSNIFNLKNYFFEYPGLKN